MANANEFRFTVTVKVQHADGPKVDRETLSEEIRIHLEDDSNPESVYPEDSEYEVTEWIVTED
jgi:hypothetical protein